MTLRLLFLSTAALVGAPAMAQQRPPAAASSSAPAAQPAPDEAALAPDEEDTITVVGQRPRGSVVGDIPPENTLTSRDIRATGATTISELLDAVAAQTGSARGRGAGGPILLLNGQRISGFRELRDLPPEAIERMEILPEEVALKYGYSADQRVVNIVLRRRFDSTSAEVGGAIATQGGYVAGKADATKLIIADGKRSSLNLHLEGNSPLLESERNIAFDPATGADPRPFRTLTGAAQSARLTGTLNRTILGDVGATVTSELDHGHASSRFGIDPFDPSSALGRDTNTDSAALGFALNTQKGKWRLSSTGNAQLDRVESDADRSLLTSLADDHSRSTQTSFKVDGTANGPLFALPAGNATATFKLGASRLDLDSRALRRDLDTRTSLGRPIGEGSASIDLPLAKAASTIGRLGANLNAGISQLSDFGTLTSLGAGLNWAPAARLRFLGSVTREEGAPSLQALGDPLLASPNVPFFDATAGRTVNVTTITGGNPDLDADRRTVWKLGGNWQPAEKLDLKLRADFVHEAIDQPQIGFPAATPALEAAFPDRFVRDAGGQLVRVDLRPVNADHSRRDTLRLGFDFTRPLKSAPPTRAQINALRARFIQQRPGQAENPGAAPVGSADRGGEGGPPDGGRGFGRGGGGSGGGRFGGGRTGGRLTLSATDTITFTDELTIAPGLPPLDYIHGEALNNFGGRPRHLVEVESGYYNNGLGVRLTSDWRSGTRVDGAVDAGDLRFSPYATFDVRLFANLGERFDIVSKHPFFLGSSVRFDIKNIFDSHPAVRDAAGAIPSAYQGDRLSPIGRTVGISFRKLFLARGLFRVGGVGGGGGEGGGRRPGG